MHYEQYDPENMYMTKTDTLDCALSLWCLTWRLSGGEPDWKWRWSFRVQRQCQRTSAHIQPGEKKINCSFRLRTKSSVWQFFARNLQMWTAITVIVRKRKVAQSTAGNRDHVVPSAASRWQCSRAYRSTLQRLLLHVLAAHTSVVHSLVCKSLLFFFKDKK